MKRTLLTLLIILLAVTCFVSCSSSSNFAESKKFVKLLRGKYIAQEVDTSEGKLRKGKFCFLFTDSGDPTFSIVEVYQNNSGEMKKIPEQLMSYFVADEKVYIYYFSQKSEYASLRSRAISTTKEIMKDVGKMSDEELKDKYKAKASLVVERLEVDETYTITDSKLTLTSGEKTTKFVIFDEVPELQKP